MPNHALLPSQRNDVFLVIQRSGVSASDFRWQEATSKQTRGLKVPQLLHSASRFYYRFDLHQDQHWCEYSPGRETLVRTEYPGDWATQKHYFAQWIADLKREVSAPDLWSSVEQETALFGSDAAGTENTPFSEADRRRVAASVEEIRRYFASTHGDDPQRLQFVDDRLAYLTESSTRLGKKDWLNLAMGVLANIVVGSALAPDAARELLRVAGAALGWLFGGSPLFPHPLS